MRVRFTQPKAYAIVPLVVVSPVGQERASHWLGATMMRSFERFSSEQTEQQSESAAHQTAADSAGERQSLVGRVRRLAVLLLILTTLSIVAITGIGIAQIVDLARHQAQWRTRLSEVLPVHLALLILLLSQLAMWFGFVQMFRLRSYRWARVSAFLSTIPPFSPLLLLGAPVGLWATALLSRGDASEIFQDS